MPILVSQHENGFLRMIDNSIRKTGLVVGDECDRVFPRNIPRGNDHKLVPRDPVSENNLLDATSRNLAPDGRSVQHIRQSHVIDVLCVSGDFIPSFFTWNRAADDGFVFQAPPLERTFLKNQNRKGWQ